MGKKVRETWGHITRCGGWKEGREKENRNDKDGKNDGNDNDDNDV
jgi:hypothetical protein